MRLTPQQAEIVREAARQVFGPETQVILFGSRVEDCKRGGDIDLLIIPESADHALKRKIRFMWLLEYCPGERNVLYG
jgi:predicted nucleotidyltransferase